VLRGLLARALVSSGRRAERAGRHTVAAGRYRAASRLAPRLASAHLNLGAVLEATGDAEGAFGAYESALAAAGGDPYANYNVGRLSFWRGDVPRAERLLRQALAGRGEFPDALVMLAYVLDAQKRQAEALGCLETALQLQPGVPGPWYNYGELLWKLGRGEEAQAALRRALEIEPRFVPAWHLLGNILRSDSRLEEALAAYGAARRVEPERFDLESAQLLTLTLSDALSAQQLFARHRAFGARLEAAVPQRYREWRGAKEPERRLRLGFLSCDFNRHPVSWFLLPLLEHLERARCEALCYHTGEQVDEVTAQVRAAAHGWQDVRRLGDEELAQLIERDAVDVLVDLTGHAGELRLGVFARRPAPVQACWLGYLHSTGLARMHYRISDARADPPGAAEGLHSERLVRLPHAAWCFRPAHAAGHAPEPPCRRNGFVTFGSFNHAPKLSGTVRRLWAEILRSLPRARLRLVGIPEGRAREDLLGGFGAAGVAAERLTIKARVSMGEYLQQFDEVDIALDSTPYGGGTTTFDALWMGVPVVTLAGERSAGRSAASILGVLGLEDWVAGSEEQYVRLARERAGEPGRIAELRGQLRARLRASPLMDEAGFARDMEAAIRGMWREWCAGAIP
jgi:predicted O-linked N-acetylglucosamine transferase (SPINDLY family)